MSSDKEFADVVDRHYAPLYRFALSLSGSDADACDLVQETFYIWVRKQNSIRDKSRVKAWLFTTLHREFLRSRRRGIRFPHQDIDGIDIELAMTCQINWDEMEIQGILDSLDQVDDVFRAPVALFYLEDMTYEEIGRTLDLPLGTVKSRLSRGVAQLRACYSKDIKTGQGGKQ